MEWSKTFETGNPIVDGQHKNLFRMVSDLHNSFKEKHSNKVLLDTIEKLSAYVVSHFKTEEDLMLSTFYPNYLDHKREHESLKVQAAKLIKLHNMGIVDVTATVSKFLSDWLQHHIKEIDFKMIDWIKNNSGTN